MQTRCQQCSKPFNISSEAVHAALDMMVQEGLSHYNAQCPHCRKINRLSRQELMHAAPDWHAPKPQPTE